MKVICVLTELCFRYGWLLQFDELADANRVLSGNAEQIFSSLRERTGGQLQRRGFINLCPRLLTGWTHLDDVSGDWTSTVQLRRFPLESSCALRTPSYRQVPWRIRFACSQQQKRI